MFDVQYFNRAILALALLVLAACGSSGTDPVQNQPPPLAGLQGIPPDKLIPEPKASCDDLRSYVANSISDLILNDFGYPAVCLGCVVAIDGSEGLTAVVGAAVDAVATPGFFEDVTGTNNQEAGVDELDLIAADQAGNFYTLDGHHLVIANGLPPENLREIASLELDQASFPDGLLFDEANSRLVIATSGYSPFDHLPLLGLIAPPSYPTVELLFVDVTDPSNPVIERRLMLEGFRLAARKIDDRVHLVSHFTPALPESVIADETLRALQTEYQNLPEDDPARDTLARDIRDKISDLIATTDGRAFVPTVRLREGDGEYVDVTQANCADVAVPDASLSYALTTIASIDSDGSNLGTLSMVNNSWNVYASQTSLYLMQTSGGWWWTDLQRQQTAIYQVAIGNSAPEYQAMGLVDGWADDSFNFSEYQGYLRVATNRWELDPATDVWARANNLYVLSNDGTGTLAQVGAVEGFGEQERIFSSRFIGDRGFIVTFRQIDPLFAFDLSDPTEPKLMGELEIPGVSTYLHPLDESHLLTIGLNGDDTGLDGRIQLQIFDVEDLSNPQRLHTFVPQFDAASGFTWSSAVFDHLAFNYFDSAKVVTIPIQYWADEFRDHFSGFAAFSVSIPDGFTELGRLDHSDLARDTYCTASGLDAASCVQGIYIESANPKRSVSAIYQGATYIYTLSDVGMKVSLAEDFSNPVAVLPLPYNNQYWWWFAD